MKKIILASACILALASPAAFAQIFEKGDGASSQGNIRPGASQDEKGTTAEPAHRTRSNRWGCYQTNPRPSSDASTSGAQTAAARGE